MNGWPTVLGFSEGAQQIGWALATTGIVLVTASLVLGIRKRRRRAGGRVTARENLERYKAKTEVRDDLERVMVEVEQMARRVSAQLDAKTIMLERMIGAADERIARLESLLRENGNGHPVVTPAVRPREPLPAARTSSGPPGGDGSAPAGDGGADELARRVYALADQGHGPAAIARQIDEHIGKVELILALRPG